MPSVGTPQRSSNSAVAPPRSARSPRNRLMTKPCTCEDNSSGRRATVPKQVREDPAALDVPDHDGGDAGPSRQAEVDEVVAEQVDLGGAPGAFADHDVEPGAQRRQRGIDDGHQRVLGLLKAGRLHNASGTAHHDHLGGVLTGRLEQYRVHGGLGFGAGGYRLQPLRPADLGALRRDHGVQRHVLPLERGHRDATAGQESAEARGQSGLPRVRGGTADHERSVHGPCSTRPPGRDTSTRAAAAKSAGDPPIPRSARRERP